ncbi:hypothetical protein AC623_14020 [Bacillus sp. FJAT-27231]|uniref:VanW family protein n=1 Tax=Bacillus sp. FJAT-27231 TaxID=1679168 RepID=UPI0006713BFA|nr:VanW family protein [Bacillus sp. FJAT-27231]KMY54913.1 hypothetical protein AC623_14020 [Bacillus sp. FJAT-27231]
MDKRGFFRILLILTIMVAYLITFPSYGAEAYEKIFHLSAGFDEGTKIGPTDVSKQTKVEALNQLHTQTEEWQKDKKITLQYVEKKAALDPNVIEFQPKTSVKEAVSGQENPLLCVVDKSAIEEAFREQFPKVSKKSLDYDAIASDLQDIASSLQKGETVIDLSLYLNKEEKQEVVAEALLGKEVLTPELQDFIKQTPEVKLKSNIAFSFLDWMEEADDMSLDEDDKNVLSSLLYRLVLQTNFLIFEKNQGTELPSYIELGYEAKVNKVKELDFIFMNESPADYTLDLKVVNNKLYGAIKGLPFAYDYKGILKNKKVLKPKTILHFSPNLPYGQWQLKQPGKNGELIQMYRVVYNEQSERMKEEKVSEDFYPPVHRIEVYSTQEPPPPVEKTEEPEGSEETLTDEAEKAPETDQPKMETPPVQEPPATQTEDSSKQTPAAAGQSSKEAK